MTLKHHKIGATIHIFAILHAMVALGCRLAGVVDELLLTILTMTMTLLICLMKERSLEYTAASIITVNIIGYILGNLGASFLNLFFDNQYIIHSTSTFATTEILGWGMVGFINLVGKSSTKPMSEAYFKWVMLAMALIFFFRLSMNFFFRDNFLSDGLMLDAAHSIFSNAIPLIILICINILYLRTMLKHRKKMTKILQLSVLILFLSICTFFEAFVVRMTELQTYETLFDENFWMLIIISGITEITLFCLIYMAHEAISARTEMKQERDKANVAQYRYLKLKRQVNPHFLFNSLNVLDCLVCEEKTEQASTYIHKLAGIYRYMIKSEEEDLVPLRDEMVFVGLYVDLLKIRFPEGFDISIDIKDGDHGKYVLPCSLQLLIENATKHNAVNPENPLKISITTDGQTVKVYNNLIPKITEAPSTGLGQKYIGERYLALSGKAIIIDTNDESYCVTLPLL